ncbi:MAG TPA: hypothetical protein ENI27_05395 [bacterium]|nr:hypothetical protein [bacterium]
MKDVCEKCSHKKTCSSPCRPVELYLSENNLSVYEKTTKRKNGESVSIIYARSRELPETGLMQKFTGKPARRSQEVFSTENENPFASFNPQLKQTGVFIDRFFNKASYDDLAIKYDVTPHAAIKIYYAATKRLFEVLSAMDTGEVPTKQVDFWRKRVEERSGHIPKGQKWFLLNKLFGLRPSEIAEMEGLDRKNSSVRQLIIRVSDQLKTGEISLIEVTPEEVRAAKARLDAHNVKRRERHTRKIQSH